MTTRTTHILAHLSLLSLLVACDSGSGGNRVPEDTLAPDILVEDVVADTDTGPSFEARELTGFVNAFVGTRGAGNVIPGPCLPHGMIKPSPDMVVDGQSIDAYAWESDRIEGFSHTHLEGPGGSGYGYSQLLLHPSRPGRGHTTEAYASTYSHDGEEAAPGYYAVDLREGDVRVELAATAHCAVHRYTYQAGELGRVLLDVGHSRGKSVGGEITIVDEQTVEGYGTWSVHPLLELGTGEPFGSVGYRTLYFTMAADRPATASGTWIGDAVVADRASVTGPRAGAYLDFTTADEEAIEIRFCLSAIDLEQARAHQAAELDGRDFAALRDAAAAAWDTVLNRIHVDGGTETQQRIFYTALYHAHLQPADMTEDGRFWSGADGEGAVHDADGWRFLADDWCMWDTFRTSHPLFVLTAPELRTNVVRSLLHNYEEGGWLPKCTWHATGYSRVMIGNHAVPIIVDAYEKGLRDFDAQTALAAMRKAATEDNDNPMSGSLCGYLNLGTPPEYLELGYIPHECDADQSASMTLEYAYNDACLARYAESLGETDVAAEFAERARAYEAHWNPDVGFMQGRNRDGSWTEPFDPLAYQKDFCEATSWIYSWFVPHDVARLIELMGGREAFLGRLDTYFDSGYHDPSNQPSFHIPYLYAYAGDPSGTQARVRALLADEYEDANNGLPGNDDAGSTSAWFLWSSLGLYPVAPGAPTYVIGSPLFDRAELHLGPTGATIFVIRAENNGPDNPYIQSATLNGEALERVWLSHDELMAGGELHFVMGPEPSAWATDSSAAPPDMLP